MLDERNTPSGAAEREVTRSAAERPRRPRPTNEYGTIQRSRTQDGTVQRPRTQDGTVQRPRTQDGTVQRPRTQDGTVQRPRTQDTATRQRPHTPSGNVQLPQTNTQRPRPDGQRPRPEGQRPRPDGQRPRRKRKLSPEEIALRRKKKRIKKIKKALKGFGIVSAFLACLVCFIMVLSILLAKGMSGLMIEDKTEETVALGETLGQLEEPLTEAVTEETTQYPTFEEPAEYSSEAMRERGVPEDLIMFYERYPEVAPYSWFYPEKSKISYDMDISKDVVPGKITYLCQWDERWGYKEFGNSYFGMAGCGPTCIAMVYSGLTGKTDKNPYQIGLELAEREYYIPGSGTTWEAMKDIPQEYGLEVIEVPCYEEDIRNTLKEGHPIICNVVPGDFTKVGHYIILTGIDDNDQLSICDPNSPEKTSQKWDLERVIVQIDALWGYAYYGE